MAINHQSEFIIIIIMQESTLNDPQALAKFIKDALEKQRRTSNSDAYYNLIRLIKSKDTDSQIIRFVFVLLKDCVTDLDIEAFPGLFRGFFVFDWNRDESTVEIFVSFLLELISSNRSALKPALSMLVKLLKPIEIKIPDLHDPSSLRKIVDVETSQRLSTRAILVIHEILKLVPSASPVLLPLLVQQFPHRRHQKDVLNGFVENALTLGSLCPSIRSALLVACAELAVSLDVELRPNESSLARRVGRSAVDSTTTQRRLHSHGNDEHELQFDLDTPMAPPPTPAESAVDMDVEKLDSLMCLLLRDIDNHCTVRQPSEDESHNDMAEQEKLAQITIQGTLEAFWLKVLTSTHTKCAQYLVFAACVRRQSCCAAFVQGLLAKLQDNNEARLTRQCAALYCGSFIARAKFVSKELRSLALTTLCEYSHRYLDALSIVNTRPSTRLHGTFYCTVQAILYIICFGYEQLAASVSDAAM